MEIEYDIVHLASPDPHDGSPANIDPEHQKEQEEVGRLEINEEEDFEEAGDLEGPGPDEER